MHFCRFFISAIIFFFHCIAVEFHDVLAGAVEICCKQLRCFVGDHHAVSLGSNQGFVPPQYIAVHRHAAFDGKTRIVGTAIIIGCTGEAIPYTDQFQFQIIGFHSARDLSAPNAGNRLCNNALGNQNKKNDDRVRSSHSIK